jgi:hypothetical protein
VRINDDYSIHMGVTDKTKKTLLSMNEKLCNLLLNEQKNLFKIIS